MPADMIVRRLSQADYPAWLALWRGYQQFYKAAIPEATTAEIFRRLFVSGEGVAGFVACIAGKPAGIAHALTHRSFWTERDYCYLQDLFVAPDQRRKGIGEALIAAVREYAAQAGCARVYWLTHETNAAAMRVYDRLAQRSGFVQYVQSVGDMGE